MLSECLGVIDEFYVETRSMQYVANALRHKCRITQASIFANTAYKFHRIYTA